MTSWARPSWAWFEPWWNLTGGHSLPLAAAQSRFLAVTYLAAPHTWLGEGRFYMPARGGGFGRTAGG